MPLNGSMSGNQFTSIVTNNAAFNVKIIPLSGALEQKPNQKDDASGETRIKVGDTVSGEIVNSKKKAIGKVVAIDMEDSEIVGYKIINDDGKEVMLDPTTTTKYETNSGNEKPQPTKGQVVGNNESLDLRTKSSSHIPSFSQWIESLKP